MSGDAGSIQAGGADAPSSNEGRTVEVIYRGLKLPAKGRLDAGVAGGADGGAFLAYEAPLPVGTRIQVVVPGEEPVEASVSGVVEAEAGSKLEAGMRLAWAGVVAGRVAGAAAAPEVAPGAAAAPEVAPGAAAAPTPEPAAVELTAVSPAPPVELDAVAPAAPQAARPEAGAGDTIRMEKYVEEESGAHEAGDLEPGESGSVEVADEGAPQAAGEPAPAGKKGRRKRRR